MPSTRNYPVSGFISAEEQAAIDLVNGLVAGAAAAGLAAHGFVIGEPIGPDGVGPPLLSNIGGGNADLEIPNFDKSPNCSYELRQSDDLFATSDLVAYDVDPEQSIGVPYVQGRKWRIITIPEIGVPVHGPMSIDPS